MPPRGFEINPCTLMGSQVEFELVSRLPSPSQRNFDIHGRYQTGESTAMLAMEYGISRQRVYQIVEQVHAFFKATL